MKKIYILGALGLAVSLSSCDDFLDKKPLDSIVDNADYWNIPQNVTSQTNRLYNFYSGYGNNGAYGTFYFDALNDDQVDQDFANWTFTNVPGKDTDGYWSTPYSRIRGCNYIITNVRKSSMTPADRAYFEGVARLNRAFQYYTLVRRYGDVIWTSEPIATTDKDILYGPRTNRDVVMDSVLADLQYAVATIGNASSKTQWSSDMARAMLVDVALFEGTYAKYRTLAENGQEPSEARAEKYLNVVVENAQGLIDAGYSLESNYGTVYNSLNLAPSKEVIFFKAYSYPDASFGHCTIAYTSAAPMKGMSRDAFNSFLFLDGKPLATTDLPTDDTAVLVQDTIPMITNALAVRDQRMKVLIDEGLGFNEVKWFRALPETGANALTSPSGYLVRKFWTTEISISDAQTIGRNTTQCPIYSFAPVLLAYAEAKYELGTITQADLDISINALNARGGIPPMTLTPEADPANNMGVEPLLWEIRRCRRCELMFDGNRYWDLIRWHQLQLLATTDTDRQILQGANLANITQNDTFGGKPMLQGITLDGTFINCNPGVNRDWNPRYYFYPIPNEQLTLNPDLKQNPGW